MTKFSIDLVIDEGGNKRIINHEQMQSLTMGCLVALLRLDKMADFVEVFKITYVNLPPKGFGPRITVYFKDPLNNRSSHITDYRFIGDGETEPSASQIADHLADKNCLPRLISEHLEKCRLKIQEAGKQLS